MKEAFIAHPTTAEWLKKLATVREFIEAQAVEDDQQNQFAHKSVEQLRQLGYTSLTLPKAYGGEGLSLREMLPLQETLGSYDGSAALVVSWTLLTVGELYENAYWPEALLQQFAQEVKQGAIINRAVSEAATGSPVRGGKPTTLAEKTATGYRLTGRKSFTTGAYALDYFLVSAWLSDQQQIGFFLLPKDTEGLHIEDNWEMVGMRGTGSHDLVLDAIDVPEKFLVEIPSYHTGFKINSWLLLISATYLGIAQAARDYAVDFANRHKPNSIPTTIAHLPNVQALLGEIEALLAQARFTLYGAADVVNDQAFATHAVNIAKYTVTNHALQIVDKAMRIVGAKSLQLQNPLQRYYRDVRAGLHNPPMDDLTLSLLAKQANKQWEDEQHV
ncbi:MAG TPA: acyl-CoA/acyl-ACP dehydrogenase [Metalysinibacillus jejuensis]|uniref:Acyl-CoA/acyl-ACP dehydrogenase n=1 Tax=Metalysinibacillus jejuensis TaxID=914327 RepID=A0A921T5T7_9BACL|nr:acyl-CoA dehydrogenase family protein [Metalysinibacillus jejuensis]HJH11781.1 acyl-CoA/acyl-ACP dehydrogenase [Metalysinibacillus jejuensis]